MATTLAFQHGDRQILNGSPTRLQATPIVAIAQHLVGIPTAAMAALPVNLTGLAADSPDHAFLSSQFGCHFRFQQRVDGGSRCSFGLLLHFLQNGLSFFPL